MSGTEPRPVPGLHTMAVALLSAGLLLGASPGLQAEDATQQGTAADAVEAGAASASAAAGPEAEPVAPDQPSSVEAPVTQEAVADGPATAATATDTASGDAAVAATPSTDAMTAPPATADASTLPAAADGAETPPPPTPAQSRYLEAVSQLEAEGGAWDPGLSQHLLSLGSAYQEAGRYADAVRALSRAAHITRINEGLYSPSDLPIVERLIESYAALGEWEAVSGSYQQLFQIHQRNYGERDPRMLPVLRKLSAWHLRAWMDAIGDEPLNHLVTARNLTDSSLDILRSSYGPSDARLVDALRERAIVDYYLASAPPQAATNEPAFGFNTGMIASPQLPEGPPTYVVNGFISGRDALEQVVQLRRGDPSSTPTDTAEALAELADWHLLFGRRQTAIDLYREAQATLAQGGEPAAQALGSLFGTPRELPVKPAGFVEPSGTLTYNAYITVNFTVDERGKPADIQVVDANPPPAEPQLDRVRKRLRYARFRPRFEGAEPVATSGLSYRYRYSL